MRQTDCFLSIGTGIGANYGIVRPARSMPTTTIKSFAGVATNTESTHIMFRGLMNAFAPLPQTTKYWRLNVAKEIPMWDEAKRSWIFWTKIEHHHADYEPMVELDDSPGARGTLMRMTERYLEQQEVQGMISSCAQALYVKRM